MAAAAASGDGPFTGKISETDEWKALEAAAEEARSSLSLRELLKSDERSEALVMQSGRVRLDVSRQLLTLDTLDKLKNLAKKAGVSSKIKAMFEGELINNTEKRKVLHCALRAPTLVRSTSDSFVRTTPDSDGPFAKATAAAASATASSIPAYIEKIKEEVDLADRVLCQIKAFSDRVRNGEFSGKSGKVLKNVICIGIGGSYLGAEFVYESLRTNLKAMSLSQNRTLKFFANIDPLAFGRSILTNELDASETLCIIISKTFTTRETIMNATLMKQWLLDYYKGDLTSLSHHFVAVSSNKKGAKEFGILEENIFEFWDWVGGRYSVTSAVGILPLSIHYSFDQMYEFLKGAADMDVLFYNNNNEKSNDSLPYLFGLISVWNTSFLKYPTRALIPYCEALARLPAHIQQLAMESNGKQVSNLDANGKVSFGTGEIDFGEPGTNAQHSFFQLIHQGSSIIPVDFLAFKQCQLLETIMKDDESKTSDDTAALVMSDELRSMIESNHCELLANCLAQCDALALGKNLDEVRKEHTADDGVSLTIDDESLLLHKTFSGNRPSNVILFDGSLDAYATGLILSLFEHRTAVEGFVWQINSFDQWGVQLGKVLAKKVRSTMDSQREAGEDADKLKALKQDLDDNYHKSSRDNLKFLYSDSS